VAVGTSIDASGEVGLIDTLSDGTWSETEARSPSRASPVTEMDGVGCPSSGGCVAVGSYERDNRHTREVTVDPFFETLHGQKWTPTVAPTVPGAALTALVSVSCATAGSCAAVGFASTAGGSNVGVIDTM
jgi:hypothetical protein